MGTKFITIFITPYFREVDELSGGLGERLVGLYGTYSKIYSKDNKSYIYSQSERKIITLDSYNNKKIYHNVSMVYLLNRIKQFSQKHNQCNIVVSWPYISITSLYFIIICKKIGCNIILDVHDLPIEQAKAFGIKMPFYKYLGLLIWTKIYFKISDYFFVVSDEFKSYMENVYHIDRDILQVIPNGTFSNMIYAKEKSNTHDYTTLVYCGSIIEGKGIFHIIRCVENVRRKGCNVILKLYGYNGLNLKSNDWLMIDSVKFSQINDVLNEADILLIPFPKNNYYDIAHPIKLSDYMAAGKAIICLDLITPKKIIEKYNCGIICTNYKQIEDSIIELSNNSKLRLELGNNGRKAAVEHLDWGVISNKMNEAIVKLNDKYSNKL